MAAAALVARMGRTVALSSDIATRVVYKRWFLEQTYETIAAELEIGTTTAWQIYQRFVQTDGVETFQGRRPNIRGTALCRLTCASRSSGPSPSATPSRTCRTLPTPSSA